jgi:hypothetical protein
MIEVYTTHHLQTIVIDSPQSIQRFKELVQRGANLWPDAAAEIKETADLITNGTILQDYRGQDSSKK